MVCVDMICAMYNRVVSMGSQQLFLFHNQPLQFKVTYINNVLKKYNIGVNILNIKDQLTGWSQHGHSLVSFLSKKVNPIWPFLFLF